MKHKQHSFSSFSLITSLTIISSFMVLAADMAFAVEEALLLAPTPTVNSQDQDITSEAIEQELSQKPILFMAYSPSLGQGTAKAAIHQLQSLHQANSMAVKVDSFSQRVSINADRGTVLTINSESSNIDKTTVALEKARLSLKDYIASGGQLEGVKPTQLPNKAFAIKAGDKVILSLGDLGVDYTLDQYIEQRTQVYDMTNSIRKAYGVELLEMKPVSNPLDFIKEGSITFKPLLPVKPTVAQFALNGTGKKNSGMASWYGLPWA